MMWPDGRDIPSCICGVVPNVNCEVHVKKFPAPMKDDKELDGILENYPFDGEWEDWKSLKAELLAWRVKCLVAEK